MRAVILDIKGMEELDLSPISLLVDHLACYEITSTEEVAGRIEGFDIVITNKTPLSYKVINASKSLKLICVLATGTDVVDKSAARTRSIPVCNAVAYGVDSVVQHVFTLILALHTNLLAYHRDVQQGRWQTAEQFCFLDHSISELKGKILGVVGYGHLGQGVANIARAFGMKVLVAKSSSGRDDADRVTLETLLRQSDVVSLHCPLTEHSADMIDDKAFSMMKPNAFLINAARGGIVNEAALADALKSGKIAGAAVDVLTEEPPRNGNVLLDPSIPNLIITPHNAWGSREARETIIQQTAENISAFQSGKPLREVC